MTITLYLEHKGFIRRQEECLEEDKEWIADRWRKMYAGKRITIFYIAQSKMNTSEYMGYELFPTAIYKHRKRHVQIKVYKKGAFQFDTSVCDTIEEARREAKEGIDGIEETAPSVGLENKPLDTTGKWFNVCCQNCGWTGSSEFLNGGGQIADTGDYGDTYCPNCGQVDPDEYILHNTKEGGQDE